MEINSIDYYPEETKSFGTLPKDSPLQHLDYGGILTIIGEQVAKKRKEIRDNRRKFLITKINNTNMGILIDKIQNEARGLSNYRASKWYKGKKTKSGFLEFFKKNDISLKYLEDLYEYQEKGMPQLIKGSVVKFHNNWWGNYGKIIKVERKQVIYLVLNDKLTFKYNSNGQPDFNLYSISIWKCEKVDIDIPNNNIKLRKDLNDKQKELEKRKEFLKLNFILNDMQIPYDFYDFNINVFGGQTPTLYTWQGPVYCNSWTIISDIIKESLTHSQG